MQPLTDLWQNSSTNQRIIFILAILCFVGLIVLGAMGLAVRARLQGTDPSLSQGSVIPARDCRPSTLVLGKTTFLIRDLDPAADGSLAALPGTSGVAYQIAGTASNPVFVLSPAPENLAVVSTIDLGSPVTATWSDCTFTNYDIYAHQMGSFNAWALPEQSQNGMTIFFPIDASGAGFVFTAGVSSEEVYVYNPPAFPAQSTRAPALANTVPPSTENTLPALAANTSAPAIENTVPPSVVNIASPSVENTLLTPEVETVPPEENAPPPSNGSEVNANIGLLDMITSPDGKTIALNISIQNYGDSVFTIAANNISLTQPDGTALVMISSEPVLPKQITPKATETFTFTFPRPASSTATLKIFTVEYDIEGY